MLRANSIVRGGSPATQMVTPRESSSRWRSTNCRATVTVVMATADMSTTTVSGAGTVDRLEDPPVHRAHVGRVERAVDAQHEESGLGHRVLADEAEIGAVRRRSQLGHADVVELPDHEEQRQQHTDEHGGEHAGEQPGERGDRRRPRTPACSSRQKRTNSAGWSRPSTAMMTMQLSVASGRSLSTPPRNRAQAIASSDGHQLAHLGHRAGALVDRRLREPAGRRHRPEEGAGDARHAVGGELLVVVDRRLRAAAHGLGDRRRLQEAHDGDGEGARQRGRRRGRTTDATGVGSPDGTGVMRATPCSSIEAKATRAMPIATATSGPGTVGANRRRPRRHGERQRREGGGRPADVAEVVDDAAYLGDDVARPPGRRRCRAAWATGRGRP